MKQQKIDPKLLEILACPICKGDVIEEDNHIICKKCNLSYPIENNIPVMLIENAKKYQE
jgi:uncharacterized protein YbaR (Trm112 family)